MVKLMEEVPGFHATFNMVPSLCMQLEEYASGDFKEPWFHLAFKHADELTREDKLEILARAFQVNHERLLTRWPRFLELFEWSRAAGGAQALITFRARDWRDLQVLSQLVWMDEEWFTKRSGGVPPGEPRKRFHGKRQSGIEGQATGIAGTGVAGLSRSGGARPDRAEHHAVLPPNLCRWCAIRTSRAWPIRARRCLGERTGIRRMRGNN